MNLKKLLDYKIVMFFLFVPFVEPFGTKDMALFVGGVWRYVHIGFKTLKWLSFLVAMLTSIYQIKKPTRMFWLMVVYQIYAVIISLINASVGYSILSNVVITLGVTLLFDYYIRVGNTKRFLSVVESVLGIWIIINLITVILYKKGMYVDDRNWWQNWFLGYKNLHIYYFLPYFSICAVSMYINNGKLNMRYYMMLFAALLTTWLGQAKTSFVALTAVISFIIIFEKRNMPKVFTSFLIYVVSFAVSILVVFVGFQKHFEYLIVDLLGKDLTLHGRTFTWARAISDFQKKPIFGNGLISYEDLFSTWTVTQMHNMFIDILVVGGVFLLIIFSIMVYQTSSQTMKCNVASIRNISIFTFIGYGLLFVTEGRRDMALLYMYMITCYYLPDIVRKYDLQDSKREKRLKLKIRRRRA